MKLVVLFMCIGICLVGGSRWGIKATSRPGTKFPPKVEPQTGKDYIATVMQMPSVYHSCNAFFVTDRILIAPATCVLCDEVCNFHVAINAVSLFDTAKYVKVENITSHPKFYKSTRGNPSYNIALLKLSEPVKDVEPLTISKTIYSKEGYIRSWTFNKAMTDFHVRARPFEKVTHYICDETDVKVKVDEICIKGHDAVELGTYNEGTVFVIDDHQPQGASSALAFFARGSATASPSKYFSFISVPYYYDWINATITDLSK